MPPENAIRDGVAPRLQCLPLVNEVDEALPPTNEKNGKVKHEVPIDISNPMIMPPPSKDKADEPHNGGEDSAGVDTLLDPSQPSDAFEKEATFYENFADAVLNDKETLHEVSAKVRRSQWDSLGKIEFQKEKDNLDIRAKQAVLYLTYTDIRIKQMEKEIKKLRRDIDRLPDDFEVQKTSKQPVYQHKLKRSSFHEFRLTDDSKAVPNQLRPALELLITEKNVPKLSEPKVDIRDDKSTAIPHTEGEKSGAQTISVLRSPERLRIRSRALVSLLERISGEIISNSYTKGDENSPVVFLRPFKLFISYEMAIRASVQELEMRIDKKATEPAESTDILPQAVGSKEIPEFDDEDLLADLKLLIEFLDVDLKPTFDLRKKIKDGTATIIEYEDLWHLFEPGDDVMTQSSRLQVYRVLNYTVRIQISHSHYVPHC